MVDKMSFLKVFEGLEKAFEKKYGKFTKEEKEYNRMLTILILGFYSSALVGNKETIKSFEKAIELFSKNKEEIIKKVRK